MAIKKLNKRHLESARLLSEFKTQREIAQTLGLSESHVSRVVHSDVFRQYREGQRKERIEQIREEIKRRYWGPYMQSHAALQTPDGSITQKIFVRQSEFDVWMRSHRGKPNMIVDTIVSEVVNDIINFQ